MSSAVAGPNEQHRQATGIALKHIVVVGPMGVGKSTTANAVAKSMGREHRDSDEDLQRLFGRSGREIAREDGVGELHRLESAMLLGALACPSALVISAAAWVVEDEACRAALAARACVVVLQASAQELLERMPAGDHRRSMSRSELDTLMVRRAPWFEQVADLTLDALLPTTELVEQILLIPLRSSAQ